MSSTGTPLKTDTKERYDGNEEERTNLQIDEKKERDGDSEEKKKQGEEEELPNLGGMMRLSSEYGRQHRCVLFWGIVSTAINGAVFPLFGYLFQQFTDALFGGNLAEEALTIMGLFMGVGFAGFVFSILQYSLWGYYGAMIGTEVRKDYFWLLMQQEMGYFDIKNSGLINNEMIADCLYISEGMGVKTGFIIQQLCAFIVGFFLAFWFSWEMSLVLMACLPVLVVVGLIQGKLFAGTGEGSDPFSKSGALANEVLVSIRAVQASPMLLQDKVSSYRKSLDSAFGVARKRATVIGFSIGSVMFGLFGVLYAVGLWYGAGLVDNGTLSVGDMIACFFSFLIAGRSLGQVGRVGEDVAKCKLAANKLFNLKVRVPKIRDPDAEFLEHPIGEQPAKAKGNGDDNDGVALKAAPKLEGNISFKDVSFSYPSAPDTRVLNNISFEIEMGKTLAIVGPSGSGKSTVIGLLERFYDPKSASDFVDLDSVEDEKEREVLSQVTAEIRLDGELIHNYSLRFLRKQIGYVSQLPLLFAESIRENIRGGDSTISDGDVEEAARFADAHDFIMKLPKGYDTLCGEMGNRLSGGQKQRIAIARAIVCKPSILLLDEATSALDTKSEREVQRAIDNISKHQAQTIVVIAHRLSTIKNADKILVVVDGEIEEQGDHHSLIAHNGVYAALVRSQQLVETQNESGPDLQGDDAAAAAAAVEMEMQEDDPPPQYDPEQDPVEEDPVEVDPVEVDAAEQ